MALKPIRQVLINGVGYSFASVKLVLSCEATGKELDLSDGGYSAIKFSRKRNRGMGRGPHPDPQFKTRGENEYSASITFYLPTFNYFIQETLGGAGYGDRFFVANLQYIENGLDPVTIDIKGCTADSDTVDNAKGPDPTQVECELNPLKYTRNGLDDVDNPLPAA